MYSICYKALRHVLLSDHYHVDILWSRLVTTLCVDTVACLPIARREISEGSQHATQEPMPLECFETRDDDDPIPSDVYNGVHKRTLYKEVKF